jgi:hypothetical protein
MWLGGPIVWALHFAILYGAESLLCSRGGPGAHMVVATAATVIALGLLAALVLRVQGRIHFLGRLAVMLGIASIAGVLATYLPVLMVPACLAFR